MPASAVHCRRAFAAVAAKLGAAEFESSFDFAEHLKGEKHFPLFITFEKAGELRGCIGTFEAQDLSSGIAKYSVIAALEDKRFPPITKEELPELKVTVSLLHHFEDCAHWDDWEVGTHGVTMEYSRDGLFLHSTFLPEVSSEHKWTKEQTMEQLFLKAGWTKGVTKNMLQGAAVERYQSTAASVEFAEYLEWAKEQK